MKFHRFFFSCLFIVFLCSALFACKKLTQSNFDKIHPGMTINEVTTLLGTPTRIQNYILDGVAVTSAVWKNKRAEINIQFFNNKVQLKSFNKIEEEKKQENQANQHQEEDDDDPDQE